MSASDEIEIRPATKDDIPFVYSTWLRCYKHDSPVTKFTKSQAFFDGHQKMLDGLLSRPTVRVAVACKKDDAGLLFGFIAHEPGIVHFVYIKKPFRLMGIARRLVEHESIDLEKCRASHLTYGLLDLWTAGKVHMEFDPYALKEMTNGSE